jgi:integrase
MTPVKLRHLHFRHNAYYYVRRQGGRVVWKRLSADLSEAVRLWQAIEGEMSKRLTAKVGLTNAHWHDLRATCLTKAKEQGGLDYAQALAGHARQATTEGYIAQRSVTKVRPIK